MKKRRFEQLVERALDSMPEELQSLLDNVVIFIEDHPSPETLRDMGVPRGDTLLGLYDGVPQTERTSQYGLVPPDRITLFQRPIEESCNMEEEIPEQIRRTVLHEVAHHFGIDEERMEEIEEGWDERAEEER
jgi:predicted Zn-dependent protease with MMP-like domain